MGSGLLNLKLKTHFVSFIENNFGANFLKNTFDAGIEQGVANKRGEGGLEKQLKVNKPRRGLQ